MQLPQVRAQFHQQRRQSSAVHHFDLTLGSYIQKVNSLKIRSCSTINTSPTFKRGIAQVAKQEKIIPFENVTGKTYQIISMEEMHFG